MKGWISKLAIGAAMTLTLSASLFSFAQIAPEPSLPVPPPVEERQAFAALNRAPSPYIQRERIKASPNGEYLIKAGAFRSFENAERLYARLHAIGPAQIVHRTANGQDFYGVYLGPWQSEADAFTAYSQALDAGMQDGKIIQPDQ